ncbi:MAG: rhodanese-like domain-containing protein [Desulfohalobiaceae bacterium]|nr:rhodanese-like domain-containing protein [Desulfohalobiaceae bacterium]
MKTQAARITPLIFFAIALGLVFTAPDKAKPGVAEDKTDPSLLVGAEYVQRYKQRNPEVQLVDVRSVRAFQRAHIPGSIHVPLSLVPHKSFLQSGPVILVGGGANPGPLLRICRKLRQKGVQASVLWGGLARWRESGGRLTGKRGDHQALNEVSPAAYYRQRGREYWRVLYVGDKRPQELDTVLPGAEIAQQDELAPHLEDGAGPRLILLVTRKGEGYDRLESALRAEGIANVFCLRGGLTAYAGHLRARRNIEKQESNQTAIRSECPGRVERSLSDACTGCGE